MSDKRRVKKGKVSGLLGIFGGGKEEVKKAPGPGEPVEEKNLPPKDISPKSDRTGITGDTPSNRNKPIAVITPRSDSKVISNSNRDKPDNLTDGVIAPTTPIAKSKFEENTEIDITSYNPNKPVSDNTGYKHRLGKGVKAPKGGVYPKEKIKEVLASEDVYSLPKVGTKNDTWKHFSTRIHPIIFDMIYNLYEQTGEPVENLVSEALLQLFKKVKPSLLMPPKKKKRGGLEIYQKEGEV